MTDDARTPGLSLVEFLERDFARFIAPELDKAIAAVTAAMITRALAPHDALAAAIGQAMAEARRPPFPSSND